jgi:crotonobetainyl-CoA:carnitine CoA-transferase CaiB-like acyl-CoA transferase
MANLDGKTPVKPVAFDHHDKAVRNVEHQHREYPKMKYYDAGDGKVGQTMVTSAQQERGLKPEHFDLPNLSNKPKAEKKEESKQA